LEALAYPNLLGTKGYVVVVVEVSWRPLKPSTHKGNTFPRCLATAKPGHHFYL
jgi:hypothetical protein